MSHDIEVFGTGPITTERLTAALAGLGLHAEGTLPFISVSREVRGRPQHAFSVEGPFPVERPDLPDVVATRLLGIAVMYAIAVEGGGQAEIAAATKAARAVAEEVDGGVYDRQRDQVIWPRTARRRFSPPKAERIDTLELQWFVRREDKAHGIATAILEVLDAWLPEAMPVRFGDYEPLPHRFADSGADGFVSEWNAAAALSWSTTRPFLGGEMLGLGAALTLRKGMQEAPHSVGQFQLTVDLRALDDVGWRREVVGAFSRLSEVSGAFFAQAAVERAWGYSGGSLWADGTTKRLPNRVTRAGAWQGPLPHPAWLAWYGELYRPLVQPFATDDWTERPGGLLRRDGEHPEDARPVEWHPKLDVPEGLR